jgi:DNA-binding beta-propeller fold protein YncE/protein-tyrosine-phosphatase
MATARAVGVLLVLVQHILLPRVNGRIDHLAIDRDQQRLYIAALGNNTVEVIDLRTGQQTASLSGVHEPQGIAVAPELKRVIIANGEGGEVQIRDTADPQFAVIHTVPLSDDADNVRYDAVTKRAYVGYGSGALAAIDPANGRKLGEVRLAGHPESFQLEKAGTRVFINVPTANQIAVVDREAMKVLATWPVTEARANYPMALDEDGHRLFIGCRRPAKVLIYDTTSGKLIGSMDIVGDTDDLFYDAAGKRLIVSGGEGFLDVFQQQDATHFTRIAHEPTAAGARTSLFVPESNRLYLAVPHRGSQQAEIRVYEINSSQKTPTVLFMCPHGAAKSVLASAYFKQLAAERGIRVRVDAAGTEPATAVSPAVAARLDQQGLALPIATPRAVTATDVANADIVISIGCDVSRIPPSDKLRRWDDVPDISTDPVAADRALRAKAQALVDEISRLSLRGGPMDR